jgi:flagellar biosynthesis GTPase FlhF
MMSYCNNGSECNAINCKCHDIQTFLESVLHLNHALSEAIHAELVAIKKIKNVVSSKFLVNLKKDLNNTLKLAMNKEMMIDMLLDEVRDRCDIIFYETECKHEKEQCRCEECKCEKYNQIENQTLEISQFNKNEKEKSIFPEVYSDDCECEKYVDSQEEYNLQVDTPKEKEEDKDIKEKKEKEEDKKIKEEKQEKEKKERKEVKEEKTPKKESEKKNLDEQKKGKEPKKYDYDNYENDEDDETFIIIRSRRR